MDGLTLTEIFNSNGDVSDLKLISDYIDKDILISFYHFMRGQTIYMIGDIEYYHRDDFCRFYISKRNEILETEKILCRNKKIDQFLNK